MALLDEQIDGKYEILQKIREGGMGAIYKVRHRLLDEVRVVKVIRAHAEPSSEASDRFLREARAAIKLRHPNIAVLHDFAVSADGQAFIVMEFIDGWNLQEVMTGYGSPPLGLSLEMARQSLKAIGSLHRHKIVHRDVSPDNLMVTRDVEGNLLVKLIDLGIAKNLEGAGGLTTTGVFLGKPRYGSPERFSGEGCDARSDLYSFGVVLYELLTGRCPILGLDSASMMAGHLFRPPLPFEETDPTERVPPELREVVLWALAKKPEDRFASAEAFLSALAQVQERFPLDRGDLEAVWAVLQPIDPRLGSSANPAGSTQFRLDQEFGAAKDLTRAVLGSVPERVAGGEPEGVEEARTLVLPSSDVRAGGAGEATRRTVPGVPDLSDAVVVPFPATTESVAPDDLDATWARRPLRKEAEPKPKGKAKGKAPAEPAPAALAGAGVARSLGRGAWILGALALAGLLGTVGWYGWGWYQGRPRVPVPPETVQLVPEAPSPGANGNAADGLVAAGTDLASHQESRADPPTPKGGPKPPPAEIREGSKSTQEGPAPGAAPRPRPLPRHPARPVDPSQVGPVQVPAMQLGALILPDQPGVESPVPVSIPKPVYPAAARGLGKSVSISVAVFVDEKGVVILAKAEPSGLSGLGFEAAAEEAARRVLFSPATRDGIAGKMWTDLRFELSDPH